MASVRAVLVRPELPRNVGAAARAAANMGLAGLDLVEPGDWRTVECWRMAWGGQELLEQARVFDTLADAVADAQYTAGLSGRKPTRVRPITVREMGGEVASLPEDATVAIVFGPESKGLKEKDLLLCQRRVVIPTALRQPSLNLAQAVMVAAYEVFSSQTTPELPLERARAEDVETALSALREGMLALGFLPTDNPDARFVEWRELFGRAGLTPRELLLMLALARRMKGARQRVPP